LAYLNNFPNNFPNITLFEPLWNLLY